MQRLSVIVAKKSSRKLLTGESSGSTLSVVPCMRDYCYGMGDVMRKKRVVKIRVYTKNLVAYLRYKVVDGHLVFDKAITEPFYADVATDDCQMDQLFPIPLTWYGTVDELTSYIYKFQTVMVVDDNACLIPVRI